MREKVTQYILGCEQLTNCKENVGTPSEAQKCEYEVDLKAIAFS